MNDIETQFLEEFNILLKKYNAAITVAAYFADSPVIAICGHIGEGEHYESIHFTRKFFDGNQ